MKRRAVVTNRTIIVTTTEILVMSVFILIADWILKKRKYIIRSSIVYWLKNSTLMSRERMKQ